jgi:hypothetical protein
MAQSTIIETRNVKPVNISRTNTNPYAMVRIQDGRFALPLKDNQFVRIICDPIAAQSLPIGY